MTWRDFVDVEPIARACFHLSGQLPPLIVFAIFRATTAWLVEPGVLRSVLERIEEIVLLGIIMLLGLDILVPLVRRAVNAIRHPILAA